MSAPPKFATLPDAIAAYLAGRSRRWAEVDGWQIDLVQAAAEAGRVREEPAVIAPPEPICRAAVHMYNLEVHDNIAAELARAAEVLPELAVPSEAGRVLTEDANGAVYYTTRSGEHVKIMDAPQPIERCPWCGHVEESAP